MDAGSQVLPAAQPERTGYVSTQKSKQIFSYNGTKPFSPLPPRFFRYAVRTFDKHPHRRLYLLTMLRITANKYQLCIVSTDLYEVPDAVRPIHVVSSHAATDKDPSKFRSIFSDNLQPIATRGKKARGTLLVDIGCSSKRAPLFVSYYNEISGGHIWRGCC